MQGDRAWTEILMDYHHRMLCCSKELRIDISTEAIPPAEAGQRAKDLATRGRWLITQLEDIEAKNQPRYVAALENVLRSESKNMVRGRFIR